MLSDADSSDKLMLYPNERSAFKPLAFWGPSEAFFFSIKRPRVNPNETFAEVNPRVNPNPQNPKLERFIRVNPTDV